MATTTDEVGFFLTNANQTNPGPLPPFGEPGTWLTDDIRSPQERPVSSVRCPYCEGPMRVAAAKYRSSRIAKQLEPVRDGMAVLVSRDGRCDVLSCSSCKQAFSIPRVPR